MKLKDSTKLLTLIIGRNFTKNYQTNDEVYCVLLKESLFIFSCSSVSIVKCRLSREIQLPQVL